MTVPNGKAVPDEGGLGLRGCTGVTGTADTALNCVTTDPGFRHEGSTPTTVTATWATTTMAQTVIRRGATGLVRLTTLRYQVTVVSSAATAQYIRLARRCRPRWDYVPGCSRRSMAPAPAMASSRPARPTGSRQPPWARPPPPSASMFMSRARR